MRQSPTGPSSTARLSTHVLMPTGQYTTETLHIMFKVCLLLSLTGTCLLTGVVTVKTLHSAWIVK
jgi:hypothetical protein